MSDSTGVVIGRFQPFHREHLEYVLAVSRLVGKIVIGLVSPRAFSSEDGLGIRFESASNPLTYYERTEMIRGVLAAERVSMERVEFVPFPVDDSDKLPLFVSRDMMCYITINDAWGRKKRALLEAQGYSVTVLWERDQRVSGRVIRQLISQRNPAWMQMVPQATAKYLEDRQLLSRIATMQVDAANAGLGPVLDPA